MLPAFLGNPNTQIRDHAVMAGVSLLGLRQGKWMYIEGQGGGGFKDYMNALLLTNQKNSDIENGAFKKDAPKKQLYDLQNDFKQTENLYHKYPAVVKAMSGKLEKIKLSK
ncbi:MAG: hypothetical protein NT144_00175 [Bacteroidia bacterium]|nr:hypothetical protein [Bacteroidia bacterium]